MTEFLWPWRLTGGSHEPAPPKECITFPRIDLNWLWRICVTSSGQGSRITRMEAVSDMHCVHHWIKNWLVWAFFCSCSFFFWYPKDALELCVDSFIAVCLFIAFLFWLTTNGTTSSSLSYYRAQVGTTCRPTSVSGRPPLFETISFIIIKGPIISFSAPLTRVCLRALLKLTAGHFIVFLADQESFWGALFQRENWRVAPVGG